jgi:hypothetical protein
METTTNAFRTCHTRPGYSHSMVPGGFDVTS